VNERPATPPTPELSAALKDEVRRKYASVAESPEGRFPYAIGRAGALALGYDAADAESTPPEALSRFVGVGRPCAERSPRRGEFVLDLGCGAGVDVLLAARAVGPKGRAIGVDLSPEMLAIARRAAAASGVPQARFVLADFERLPFADASFDLATANGALNLAPDKAALFREIRRVLKPGGELLAADLFVRETVPPEVLAAQDAWSH
jgi:SAM-dependent methyltransferase